MSFDQTGSRPLKKKIKQLLLQENLAQALLQISDIPARKAINPLFSFLCSLDELLKWRAVAAMGEVVTRLADTDLESARVIVRRCMWNLNDESGGIGWGCPEAMGEIMARNKNLAAEFWCILISYMRPDGSFIEHEVLQRGVLWGVGRLARIRPQFLKDSADYLIPYMLSEDPYLRGLAVWSSKMLRNNKIDAILSGLTKDDAKLSIFVDGHLMQYSVGQLAKEAMDYDQE
jgi:hypothetical protein